MQHVVGLDIGGANLKAASSEGQAVARPFELWKSPEGLAVALTSLLHEFPGAERLAVTMTGELADCFATKAEGVAAILAGVEQAAGKLPIAVWQTTGAFVTPAVARETPLRTAAANWHATATWAGSFAPEPAGLLIDVGSTTTDIIPLRNGRPASRGCTDPERLLAGELAYTGVRRTPLCALSLSLPYRGEFCPVAAEWFATTLDVYLLLGEIPEDPVDRQTANGRPATRAAAHDRLARMLCADRTEFTASDAETAARYLADVQRRRIAAALGKVLSNQETPPTAIILAGSGSFLARAVVGEHRRLCDARLIELEQQFSPAIAECACAYAVACLARQREWST